MSFDNSKSQIIIENPTSNRNMLFKLAKVLFGVFGLSVFEV